MKQTVIHGTVLKVTSTHIVLLTEEGTFKNAPLPKASEIPLIGQAYTVAEKKKSLHHWYRYGAIAVALWLLVFTSLLFPFGGKAEEAFIVTIDINPSLEVITDDKLRVMRAEGLNEEGQKILESLQLEKNLSVAMQQIVDETINRGFIQAKEPLITTSVVSLGNDSEEVIPILEEAISLSLEEHHVASEVVVSNEEKVMYEEAKENNLSVNYYKEYKALESKGIVKKQDDIKGKSLAELKRMNKGQRKEERSNQKDKEIQDKKEQTHAAERANSGQNEKNNKPAHPANEKRNNQSENQNGNGKGTEPKKPEKPAKSDRANERSENKGKAPEKKGNRGNEKGKGKGAPANERGGGRN
jgi:hypothetical protein